MRIQPHWWIGLGVYLAYMGWVFAAWTYLDIDYAALGAQANLLRGIRSLLYVDGLTIKGVQNLLREQGVALEEAIARAGEIRILPILLTSATAIGGLLPLAPLLKARALQRQQLHQPPGQGHTACQGRQLHQHRGAQKGLHPQAHIVQHRFVHCHRAGPQRFQPGWRFSANARAPSCAASSIPAS